MTSIVQQDTLDNVGKGWQTIDKVGKRARLTYTAW
jgi:hypothetical protein